MEKRGTRGALSWPHPLSFHLQALPVLHSSSRLRSSRTTERRRETGTGTGEGREDSRPRLQFTTLPRAGVAVVVGGGRRPPAIHRRNWLRASEANAAVLVSQICSAALCSPGNFGG